MPPKRFEKCLKMSFLQEMLLLIEENLRTGNEGCVVMDLTSSNASTDVKSSRES